VARQKLEFKPQGRSLELCLRTTELSVPGARRVRACASE